MSLESRIAKNTGLQKSYIERLIRRAPRSYKTYTIPKRTGGSRTIHHPSSELKILQRWIARHIFEKMPVHADVYSYRPDHDIRKHALRHQRNNYLLRLDLQNFFPSIRAVDIREFLRKNSEHIGFEIDENDLNSICQITCWKNGAAEDNRLCLTIGAPSSPVISNVILFDLDSKLAQICMLLGVTYTRYADDLYFSTNEPNVLTALFRIVRETIEDQESPRLRINVDKTVFTSRKHRKVITGLVISSENKISLGREKKRFYRSLIYKFIRNELPPEEISRVRGLINFAFQVDRAFARSVIDKYGVDVLARLQIGNLDKYVI